VSSSETQTVEAFDPALLGEDEPADAAVLRVDVEEHPVGDRQPLDRRRAAIDKVERQVLGQTRIVDDRRRQPARRAFGGDAQPAPEIGAELRPALERAFESGKPALVNVLTDPEVVYPRKAVLA